MNDVVSCWFVHDQAPKLFTWLMSDHYCSAEDDPHTESVRAASLFILTRSAKYVFKSN